MHHGLGTPERFEVEGRVIERRGGRPPRAGDSRLRNLWRSLRRLVSDEEDHARVRVALAGARWDLRSDEEGYFALRAPTPPAARPGWNRLVVEAGGGAARCESRALIVPAGSAVGIISDFDDTIVVSEVGSRRRLLAHSLLENYLQRAPVPGMAAWYRGILARNPRPEEAPVIYLTAAPRQLQAGIEAFLQHHGFPPGVVLAKRVSGDKRRDPILDQQRYKTARIEAVLDALAGARFVLVGDDGESDPEIYRDIAARHPNRVDAVFIRRVSSDPDRPAYAGQEPPPVRTP